MRLGRIAGQDGARPKIKEEREYSDYVTSQGRETDFLREHEHVFLTEVTSIVAMGYCWPKACAIPDQEAETVADALVEPIGKPSGPLKCSLGIC